MLRSLIILGYLIFLFSDAYSQPALKVAAPAWLGLSEADRFAIQQKYVVESIAGDNFGIIIDAQGANRSTPGSNAGVTFGEAIGSASYIDRSFNHGNYSAKNHLGAMLLGGLIGAALDSKPQSLYQFRYTIKNGNGNIAYQDTYASDPFRHSPGVCVQLPEVTVVPEQHLCSQTTNTLRDAYVSSVSKGTGSAQNQPISSTTTESESKERSPMEIIKCKIGNLAPIDTTSNKCKIVNGVVIDD